MDGWCTCTLLELELDRIYLKFSFSCISIPKQATKQCCENKIKGQKAWFSLFVNTYMYFKENLYATESVTVYISPHKQGFLWWNFCMEWINLVGDVTLRQSWSIKFVIANRAVRAELNGKCAAPACLWVYSTAEDRGPHFDSAARPIYSAALAHTLTWTAASLGFYI